VNIFSEIAIRARNSIHEAQCNIILTSSSPFSRATTQGHITASGLVIKDDKALLIFIRISSVGFSRVVTLMRVIRR